MKCSQVAVLRGGPSSEYDISLQTGKGVLDVLANESCHVRDIIISRGGDWVVEGFKKTPEQALVGVDIVFIALHGAYGEDGTVQRILDRLGVPYTGSGAYASALAMNKALTKDFLQQHGIKMAKHLKLTRDGTANVRQAVEKVSELFGPEYIVKPVAGGSSLHTQAAHGSLELTKALEEAFLHTDAVLVEERIRGREATVGVLDKYRGIEHYTMPVIEIVPPATADFFAADVKYTGETEEICPGRFSAPERDELLAAAQKVHQVMGLRHYSRSDFIVRPDGVYFLEVNTLPGLTAASLFPKAIDAVGGTYRELITHLVNLALKDVTPTY